MVKPGNCRPGIRRIALAAAALVCLWSGQVPAGGEGAWVQGRRPEPEPQIIVTYWHRTVRCITCRNMETMAAEVLQDEFADELATGLVAWRALDFDLPENAETAAPFGLDGPAIVIEGLDGGRRAQWRDLPLIWQFADDPVRFRAYVSHALHAAVERDDFQADFRKSADQEKP